MRARQLAMLAACLAAASIAARTAAADATSVCVAAGVLATQSAPGAVPTPVGPELQGPDRAGTTDAATTDAATGLSVASDELGVAGCADTQGTPGGTSLRTTTWSVLGGAVRGSSLRADLVPATGDGSGWRLRTTIDGLQVAGRAATIAPGGDLQVGDWGVLHSQATVEKAAPGGLRWWRAALSLELTASHGGFPAGTTFLLGWVAADRAPAAAPTPPAPPTTTATTTTAPTTTAPATTTTKPPRKHHAATTKATPKKPAVTKPKRHHKPVKHAVKKKTKPKPLGPQPLKGTPPLGNESFVFPVAGNVSWGDTYGGARSDVSDGWHHGDDLFAPLGTPVVAVTDGTVFSVGWNRIGGWRLWLIDANGNQYYYAHLSGYTKLGSNDEHVKRGDVLGYVGNTGDAVTTDAHLHFEIHPNPLLYLGYDGAVDPTTYLARWPQARHVKTLPPVALPGSAPTGWGSLTDFRRLLALRPMKQTHTGVTPPASTKEPTVRPQARFEPRAGATASAPTGSPSNGDGPWAAIAGLLLVAGALLALLYTTRASRVD